MGDSPGKTARGAPKRKKAPKKKADPKEAILDAAETIVAKEGYPKVTTRRLGTQAGVNPALVHYHFGSVEEVLLRVLKRVTDRSESDLRQAMESQPNDLAQLRTLFSTIIPGAVERGSSKQWLECIAMALNHPEMQERVQAQFASVSDVFVEQTGTALAASTIPADDDLVAALAALVHAASDGVVLQMALGYTEGHEAILRLIDTVLDSRLVSDAAEAPAPAGRARTRKRSGG